MKKVFAAVLAAGVICAALTGCGGTSSGNINGLPTFPEAVTQEPVKQPNPEYEKIFTDCAIVDMPTMFPNLQSEAFVSLDEDGWIEKLEFGYSGDKVLEMVNTIYVPISDYTDEERQELDALMKESLAGCIGLDFCETTSDIGNTYYKLSMHFSQLDEPDHVHALAEYEIVNAGIDEVSMQQTTDALKDGGYIQR